MRQSNLEAVPRALPKPVLELCSHLEERGIRIFSRGEGLLDDLLEVPRPPNPEAPDAAETAASPRVGSAVTRSLLCAASAEAVLRALPRAVVTGEHTSRITQPTAAGPVDLVFTGAAEPEQTLLAFGLGPLSFGFRPADESWCDPAGQRAAFLGGRLELASQMPNPFAVAPRRYWIAARLIAEHGLEAAPDLLAAARDAFPEIEKRLPQAAPARRELTRILAAPHPGRALAFLRESGVAALLVPGTLQTNEERIGDLPPLPAVRWAAWLRGSATASALIRFRVPHALARQIERLQSSHPLERSVEAARDLGLRKLLQRHDAEEIEALLTWRRLELAAVANPAEAQEGEARLAAIEVRLQQARASELRSGQVRSLALDGRAVMAALGAGPGRHVGQALAHLARFVADHPDANERTALEVELREWATRQTNLLD